MYGMPTITCYMSYKNVIKENIVKGMHMEVY